MPCPEEINFSLCARMSLWIRRFPTEPNMDEKTQEIMRKTLDCTECYSCVEKCPYELDIPKLLKEVRDNFDNVMRFLSLISDENGLNISMRNISLSTCGVVTGIYKLHTGTDIRAPIGANFIAANDGVVVKAGMNFAYGNMVMIDHGGGVMTLYAHGSEICVELGQKVKRGEIVLKVGSTGYSTGPHAHFEVRINGQYVNPLDYITSYNNKKDENTNTVENQIVETVTLN